MKDYKVLIADFDGTLVDTLKGGTFPEGIWDMRIKWEVWRKIKLLSPRWVLVASNQGGIESGHVDEKLYSVKLIYIVGCLEEYLGRMDRVVGTYCPTNKKEDRRRKPNTGMVEDLLKFVEKEDKIKYELSDCLMIGDASGKEGQFSDSDRKCAENIGIDYLDVEDFLKAKIG